MNTQFEPLETTKVPLEQTHVDIQPNLLDEAIAKTQGMMMNPQGGLDYEDLPGLWRLSGLIFRSKLYPKGYESQEAILIGISKGRSVGIKDAMQALESIAVINGRALLWGDAPLAVCRQNPKWDEAGFEEFWEVQGQRIKGHPQDWSDKTATAVCITRRKRGKPREERFAVSDAIKAGLWGANGKLYGTYPQRMLKFRARGYNLRDNFGDSLKGLAIRELYEGDELSNGDQPASKVADLNEKIKEKQNSNIAEPVWKQIVNLAPSSVPEPEPPVTMPEPEKTQPATYSAPGQAEIKETSTGKTKEKPPALGTMKNKLLPLIARLPTQEERTAYKSLVFQAKTTEELTTLQRQINETIPTPVASSENEF